LKDFFVFFKTASQDILEQVGQEAALKRTRKDSKSEDKEYGDRFICDLPYFSVVKSRKRSIV
jgi:hypothetical protein